KPCHLLFALTQKIVAQRRRIRSCAKAARSASGLRCRCHRTAGRTDRRHRLPYRPRKLFLQSLARWRMGNGRPGAERPARHLLIPNRHSGNIMSNVLTNLGDILEQRKQAAADSSYVASLYHKGLNKILEKIGEEATETIIAAKDAERSGDNSDVIYETADLWFHSLVALAKLGERPEAVLNELARRFNMSGLEEKASRQPE